MAKKLYAATIEMVYYFMAEEGDEERVAKKHAREAVRDAEHNLDPSVHQVKLYQHLLDVSSDLHDDELVYGVDGDVTLKEAFELSGYDYKKEEEIFAEHMRTGR